MIMLITDGNQATLRRGMLSMEWIGLWRNRIHTVEQNRF